MGANREQILEAIAKGRSLEVHGYIQTKSYQEKLDFLISACLAHYEKNNLFPVVNAVVQEMALLASISIMRNIFYLDRDMDINDTELFQKYEPEFEKEITSANREKFFLGAKKYNLFLDTRITHNSAGMRIEIFNNAVHNSQEEEKLRQMLREAMQYDNIMSYFKDHPSDKRAIGFGLAYSFLMLKKEKIRPELMRIGSIEGITTSRLEVPFDTSFNSIRDSIMNDEVILPFEKKKLYPDKFLDILDSGTKESGTKHICPICKSEVEENIFFTDLTENLIDTAAIQKDNPEWDIRSGACANCIAMYMV